MKIFAVKAPVRKRWPGVGKALALRLVQSTREAELDGWCWRLTQGAKEDKEGLGGEKKRV